MQFMSVYEPLTIAMVACCGVDWIARKSQEHGHQVKFIPPQ